MNSNKAVEREEEEQMCTATVEEEDEEARPEQEQLGHHLVIGIGIVVGFLLWQGAEKEGLGRINER